MAIINRHAYKIVVLGLGLLLAGGLALSCAHTVDYETIDSTKPPTIPPGPALIRFLSVIDNINYIYLYPSLFASTPYATAPTTMDARYFPIANDTLFKLYAKFNIGPIPGRDTYDSIIIRADSLTQFSMVTVVLFQTHPDASSGQDTGVVAVFADDSMKRVIAPKGFCYIRFINGLPDAPNPFPIVNLHIDSAKAQPFYKDSAGQSKPVYYQEVRNYVLFPIGQHTIYASGDVDQTQTPYFRSALFEQGKYYTVRLAGIKANNSDFLSIDPE
jgi:hypothetical protein